MRLRRGQVKKEAHTASDTAQEQLGRAGTLAASLAAMGCGLAGTLGYGTLGLHVSRRTFFVAVWALCAALTLLLPMTARRMSVWSFVMLPFEQIRAASSV
jgi:hypothetical protein